MQKLTLSLGAFLILAFAIGCSQGVREEVIETKSGTDPLSTPRFDIATLLLGQALGSEVASFPHMIEEVKKADSKRGDILAKGLDDIQKASPSARAGLAKDLLTKLQ